MTVADLPPDHQVLDDTRLTRAYFARFARISGHLGQVAAIMQAEGRLTAPEVEAIARYVVGLGLTFRALANKYHFAARWQHAGRLTFDRVDSGFPVFGELLQMANDAAQSDRYLADTPSADALKDDMVRVILSEQAIPTRLQFALSQRLYHEELKRGGLFWARNEPEALWLGDRDDRRQYQVRWAVYDSSDNLPVIYLMEVDDSGRTGLPKDSGRWAAVRQHLMAQSLMGLKLVTIATGFDQDFADLHPRRLRRFRLGPMHSRGFTSQLGPIRDVLDTARADEHDDWALVWTEEELVATGTEQVKTGWFGTEERQIYALDGMDDSGASRSEQALILPERPYQALAGLDPPALRRVRKFVVGANGQVLVAR